VVLSFLAKLFLIIFYGRWLERPLYTIILPWLKPFNGKSFLRTPEFKTKKWGFAL
jgi:hypothetical protein